MHGHGRSVLAGLTSTLLVLLSVVTGQIPAHAATALIMGGTRQPDPYAVPGYVDAVERLYIDRASSCKVGTCQLHGTITPEQFAPFFTDGLTFQQSLAAGLPLLDADVRHYLAADGEPVVVFGNSQSATLATEEKRALAADSTVDPNRLQFVLIGDPNRPNGGFLQRFYPITIPLVGYRPTRSPVDTGGPVTTDISFQYDIAADFPAYPLNAFAMLNTFIANAIHGSYTSSHDGYSEADLLTAISDPGNRQVIGNTTYVTIPTRVLPLAQAIRDTGYTLGLRAITAPLADLLEPTLRVLVELGYDRNVQPGKQVSFGLVPAVDPGKVLTDLVAAAGQGVNDAVRGIAARTAPPVPSAPQPAARLVSSPAEPPVVHTRADDAPAAEPVTRTSDAPVERSTELNDVPAQLNRDNDDDSPSDTKADQPVAKDGPSDDESSSDTSDPSNHQSAHADGSSDHAASADAD